MAATKKKYNFFIEEIKNLEAEVVSFIQKYDKISEYNKILTRKLETLERENKKLKTQLSGLTKLSNNTLENNINFNSNENGEKELIKNRIDEIVRIIDYHLSS